MTARLNRRRFLTLMGGGAAGVASGGYALTRNDPPDPAAATDRGASAGAAPPADAPLDTATPTAIATDDLVRRALVVVEMAGGNDGLSFLVPYADGAYHDLRTSTLIDPATVLELDDRVGLHPNLTRLHARGVVIVQGVGTANPDGSHFVMMERWWTGDPDGQSAPSTGFLGRLCDAVGDPRAACVGLSVGLPSRALVSDRVNTMGMPGFDNLGVLAPSSDDVLRSAFAEGFDAMMADEGGIAGDDLLAVARKGGRDATQFAQSMTSMDKAIEGDDAMYPGSNLAYQLQAAARALDADIGVRVIHTSFGDFDTHENHMGRYPGLMDELDQSIDAFLIDLERRGLADSVLVMTTSEFGRRPEDNGSAGLDHGAASHTLMVGPVRPALVGEYPSLTALDGNGDLVATVSMAEYYATAATWLGVDPAEVLAGNPQPFTDLW